MSTRARHGGYIFQRPGSANWYCKFRHGGKRIEKSLGTPDKLEAEKLVAELIGDHKAALLAARPRLVVRWRCEYAPGRHTGPNGEEVIVSPDLPRKATVIHKDGTITTHDNGGLYREVDFGSGPVTNARFEEAITSPPAPPPKKTDDDSVIETYLKHANVTGYPEREAREVWAQFRRLCDKPLRDADRNDGRKLVAHYEAKGNKSASIRKKLVWLNAAVNLAISEGKLRFNPFAGIVVDRGDSMRKVPLSEADMEVSKRNLHKLGEPDVLLFRLLAHTGMRLEEAFTIEKEEEPEEGCRFVIVGTKTQQSLRRVPLPDFVPPITERLFAGTKDAAGKRLNAFIRDCGIGDKAKTLHSLRHRAKDRMRAARCPIEVQYELFGHEKKTAAAGYGHGSPVPLLREWQNKIGC